MAGRHHNIFWYYRGPSSRGAAEEQRVDRQVEDNTTKALITVLENGATEVLASFVNRFAAGLASNTRGEHRRRFYLQRGPRAPLPGPRVLLGLSPQGEIAPGSFESAADQASRIDAAIEPGGGGLLVIEVKTAGELDGGQLVRHARAWSIETPDPGAETEPPNAWELVRWPDVWHWARRERERHRDPLSGFLLEQFADYLAILGLAPWSGFRPEDFEVFTAAAYEQRAIVKNRLTGLWERVLDRLSDGDRDLLGKVEVGRFGAQADHLWAQTNRGENVVNLSLELSAPEVQLNVVAWNKRPAGRLEAWLAERTRPPVGLELIVHERLAGEASQRANWRASSSAPLGRFSFEEVLTGAFALWREQWLEQHDSRSSALAYHLRRTWSREEVLGRGEEIADEVAQDVGQLLPLLREINRWA